MNPILFNLGPVPVYSFGLFLTVALFLGAFYAWREGKNEFGEEVFLDTIVVVVACAFLGARLFYIFTHPQTFDFNLLRWLHFYLYPGFSFWGGVLGGVLGAGWFTQKKNLYFWRMADFLVLGASLGQIFGQVGCFLNGCTVGKITALPWGLPVVGFLGKRHPVALYDLLAAVVVFLGVLSVFRWIFPERRKREGHAFLTYLILMGFFSFPLEFLKEGGVYFYGLKLNQWMGLLFFVTAVGLGYFRFKLGRKLK